jgi:hypothetical protein
VWGRTDIDRGRFARQVAPKRWAHDPWSYGLVDGQTPEFHYYLKDRGHWPAWRKLFALWEQKRPRELSNEVVFPFAQQAIRQAEQKPPEVTPERGRAEEIDKIARRLELLEAPTDPNSGPSRSFARGVYREEKIAFLSQRTERAIQKTLCARYKPSAKLELKRLGTPKRVAASPLLTRGYLAYTPAKTGEENRALSAWVRAAHGIPPNAKVIVSERAAAQTKAKPKIGRPPIGDQPMSHLERKHRSRPPTGRKRGRPPHGAIAKTNAEYARDSRRRKKLLHALVPPERRQAAGLSPPQGRPAVDSFKPE